jgi:DnaK suppressor protein
VSGDLNLMGDEALRAADPDVDTESVADHGSDAYERNLTLGLMEHDSRTLRQIDSALILMDQGTYGLCNECDDPIPLARLEAIPFATTCVPCQEKSEGSF